MDAKKNVKILVIGTCDKKGGAATISWQIKTELEKRGFSFSYFVADKFSSDLDVYTIKKNKIIKFISFFLSIEDLYQTDWIMKTPQYKDADIVHFHNLHGRFFNLGTLRKMSLEKPVVWTLHDEWAITPHCVTTFESNQIKNGFYQCPNKEVPPRLLWRNERFLMWRKKTILLKSKINIIVPSVWLKNRVEKSYLNKQKIKLIYNGIDVDIFKKEDSSVAREKLNLPKDKIIIFFLADGGKKIPWKGWEYTKKIIDNFSKDKNILFVCAGNDDLNKKENNILYLPLIKDRKVLAGYYSACDLLLYPATSDNFPLTILEAMACGLPVVSFDTGGIKEALIHKENGYIADYKNEEDLFVGIKYILNLTKEQRNEMSEKSRLRVVSEFNLNKMVSEYERLYLSLINKV